MIVPFARVLLLAALCLLSAATAAQAGLGFWTNITPRSFGPSTKSIAVDPALPTTLYALGVTGTLFRSDDGGQTWYELSLLFVERLAINPVATATLYATTTLGPLYRSLDRGSTWAALSVGDPDVVVISLAIDPSTPAVLYAGTNSGMFKSVDGGDHWTRSAGIPDDVWVGTITVNPVTPTIVFASGQGGWHRSTDRGDTWNRVDGLPDVTEAEIVFDPVTSSRTYVVSPVGVFRSNDGGETWTATAGSPLGVRHIVIDPDSPEILYAAVYDFGSTDDRGLFKTTNGGDHWVRLNDGLGTIRYPVATLVFDTAAPRRLYASSYAGVFVTEDGGENWTSVGSMSAAPFLVFAAGGAGRLYVRGDAGVYVFSLLTFADVSPADPLLPWIEALYAAGLTNGCATSPPAFCPDDVVTRAQAAVLVVRGVLGPDAVPPPATGGVFDDVTPTSFAAPWIEQLGRLGLTAGCGPRRYCPAASLQRGQAAVLLLRARHGAGYQPPAPSGAVFADVPTAHPFAAWIEQLAREGITAGCGRGPARFCPDAPITRREMAVLLVGTFRLPFDY